jgi:RNA polymerase sigma-70 factor (ECF subfamily)
VTVRSLAARALPGSSADADLEALVAAARSGDRAAFDTLVRRTYADVYTLAFRLVSDEDDAVDVAQEAYLRAYRALPGFRGDARFTTWLYRITANCAVTHRSRRRRHRHQPIPDDLVLVDLSHGADPVGEAERADVRTGLEAALAELPPKLRAVVVLRDVYGLPHDAIAAELGISESAAKVRLHRARRRLKERLYGDKARHGDAL